MEDQAYKSMSRQEGSNWYYLARLSIIGSLLKKHVVQSSEPLRIVDVGCGTGHSTIEIAKFGHMIGLEPSSVALTLLKEKFPELDVRQGVVDDIVSVVGADAHDLVTALGVLYHRDVSDPSSAVRNIAKVLRSGGWFLWNECIYPQLWREHDDFVHCGRRFYPREMHAILEGNGFDVIHSSNLLAWGTPIALALSLCYRIRTRVFRRGLASKRHTDDRPLPDMLNRLLMQLTDLEWRLGESSVRLPFGVSRIILARKRE